jgi:2-C-methyl-D-erythritol 4-phosphate cytidylyltransferase
MRTWVIVPAAGVGRRFGGDTPKQYQLLCGKPVIEHTLERLLQLEDVQIVVAVSPDDHRWQPLPAFQNPRIQATFGGDERADSVRLALESIQGDAEQGDWVLVHDVARPCVRVEDIQNLMAQLASHKVGGVLATPVSDTVKRVAHQTGNASYDIAATEDRSQLWAAQTPQMFRYGLLLEGLRQALQQNYQPTDESAAIECLGHTPRVVEGSRDNIKITRLEDIAIAEAIMAYQNGPARK